MGVGIYQASQNIGVQGMNDNPLDAVCNSPGGGCLSRGSPGGSSPTQTTNSAELFAGWRSGSTALEIGLSDLGTYRVEDQATFTDKSILIRSNVTMTAVHASVLGYMGPFFIRAGGHLNHTSVQSAIHTYAASHTSDNYSLSGVKGGLLYGIGVDIGNFRIESKRFANVGVMDVTGQTDVGVTGISYRLTF
jgi:hypothetical protein